MKKLTNTLLALTAITGIAFGASNGFETMHPLAAFIIGLSVAFGCTLTLIDKNTDWLKVW